MAKTTENKPNTMPFGKRNYRLMIVGVLVLILGYTIMGSDQQTYGFGFLGLTLGPLVVMTGFIVEFFAILLPPHKKS